MFLFITILQLKSLEISFTILIYTGLFLTMLCWLMFLFVCLVRFFIFIVYTDYSVFVQRQRIILLYKSEVQHAMTFTTGNSK